MTDRPPGRSSGRARSDARARTFRRRRLAVAAGALAVVVLPALALTSLLDGDDAEVPAPRVTLPAFVDGDAKRALEPAFTRAAAANHLPPALLMALAWRESRWRAEAYNPESGATGIGQLLPATSTYVAQELLHDPSLDPTNGPHNIRLTARYLRALIERFDGDTRLGLASYLQGSTSVANDGVSAQTDAYLADIEAIRARFAAARRGDPGDGVDPLGS